LPLFVSLFPPLLPLASFFLVCFMDSSPGMILSELPWVFKNSLRKLWRYSVTTSSLCYVYTVAESFCYEPNLEKMRFRRSLFWPHCCCYCC